MTQRRKFPPRNAKAVTDLDGATAKNPADQIEGRLPIQPGQVTDMTNPVTSTENLHDNPTPPAESPGFSAFDQVEAQAKRIQRSREHHLWWPGSAGDVDD